MNFIVRSAKPEDIEDLFELANQFSLLNLPSDREVIEKKIENSVNSFAHQVDDKKANYLFVVEDLEKAKIVGSSQIKAQNGSEENPSYSFEVLKKEKFSKSLGVGFVHKVLRLKENTQGPSEMGGLVVHPSYRKRSEKVGRQVALSRYLYIAMKPSRFSSSLHTELAPPLTKEGRSEFWEALGRRFCGLTYLEADRLTQKNKEFIKSLFPEEDIYLCLLDPQARMVLGQVSEQTQPALHMIKKMGFQFAEEVDPFDGGPHYRAKCQDIPLMKNYGVRVLAPSSGPEFKTKALIAKDSSREFVGAESLVHLDDDKILVPELTRKALGLDDGDKVHVTPLTRWE